MVSICIAELPAPEAGQRELMTTHAVSGPSIPARLESVDRTGSHTTATSENVVLLETRLDREIAGRAVFW